MRQNTYCVYDVAHITFTFVLQHASCYQLNQLFMLPFIHAFLEIQFETKRRLEFKCDSSTILGSLAALKFSTPYVLSPDCVSKLAYFHLYSFIYAHLIFIFPLIFLLYEVTTCLAYIKCDNVKSCSCQSPSSFASIFTCSILFATIASTSYKMRQAKYSPNLLPYWNALNFAL